jgi:purine-binding chemotaxis protein CheW
MSSDTGVVEEVQVLEFGLGEESYCMDIGYVEELVNMEDLTLMPNTPDHVEGVMDLRGRTTTIIDPKELMDVDANGTKHRVIVFDPDETDDWGAIGWVVDEVYEVSRVAAEDVEDPHEIDTDSVRGVVKRDDGYVVWIEPTRVGT